MMFLGKNMRLSKFQYTIKFCVICVLCVINCKTYATNPGVELKAILNKIHSMQANFKQNVYSETQKLLHTYTGTMALKKPNSFRFEIQKPFPSLLVTNGVKIWNFDADLEQVTIQKYTTQKEITPLSFVLDDPKQLSTNFAVTAINSSCYKLTPVLETVNFVSVEVCFANNTLSKVQVLDHMGQTSYFEFFDVKSNISIDKTQFTFNPPVGVDVIGD